MKWELLTAAVALVGAIVTALAPSLTGQGRVRRAAEAAEVYLRLRECLGEDDEATGHARRLTTQLVENEELRSRTAAPAEKFENVMMSLAFLLVAVILALVALTGEDPKAQIRGWIIGFLQVLAVALAVLVAVGALLGAWRWWSDRAAKKQESPKAAPLPASGTLPRDGHPSGDVKAPAACDVGKPTRRRVLLSDGP